MELGQKKLNVITSIYSNLNCKYCLIDQYLPPVENVFSRREIARIFGHFKDKGIGALSFIGGEPLMNTYRLIEMLKIGQNFFHHFSLLTNGTLLEKSLLDYLIELGIDELKINLLSLKQLEFSSLAGLIKTPTIPVDIIKYANSRLTTILYIPVFGSEGDGPNISVLNDFNDFMKSTNSKSITFLTTKSNQFSTMSFYKNISAAGKLILKDDHLEIYNTTKYSIGFLDIIAYVSEPNRYYLYPDLKVRTSLSNLDTIYEIV